MKLPKRKQNRLKNCDYRQNGVYFITIYTKVKGISLGGGNIIGGHGLAWWSREFSGLKL
ncbi:MAG: hypothetical protein RR234_03995 [Christensenella sp.]